MMVKQGVATLFSDAEETQAAFRKHFDHQLELYKTVVSSLPVILISFHIQCNFAPIRIVPMQCGISFKVLTKKLSRPLTSMFRENSIHSSHLLAFHW